MDYLKQVFECKVEINGLIDSFDKTPIKNTVQQIYVSRREAVA